MNFISYNNYNIKFFSKLYFKKLNKLLNNREFLRKFLHLNFFLLKWLDFILIFGHHFFFVDFLFYLKKRYFFKYLVINSFISKDLKLNLNFSKYYNLNFLSSSLSLRFDLFYNLNHFAFVIFRLNENLFLYKNFLLNSLKKELKNALTLKKNFINFFLKNSFLNVNFYFVKYKLYGLGFKIKKVNFFNQRILSLEIGMGHRVYYLFSEYVKCLRRKRHFFIFSNDIKILNNFSYHFSKFKRLNPYKIRGIKDVKLNIKMKKGKKQGQKK